MDPTQTASVNSLLSPGTIKSTYTKAEASQRLSTISNILNDKFGESWKIILLLLLLLIGVAFIIVLFIY